MDENPRALYQAREVVALMETSTDRDGNPIEINMRDPKLAMWLLSNPIPSDKAILVKVKWGNRVGHGRWPEVEGARRS